MSKVTFVGFSEVNTPKEIIVNQCHDAEESLKKEGMMQFLLKMLTKT